MTQKQGRDEDATARRKDYRVLTDLELLRGVRSLLPGKWEQGSNAFNELLLPTSPIADNAVRFCLRGACIRVLKPTQTVVSCDLHTERSPISKQIARALGFETNAWAVQWNDTQGRTEAQVLARVDYRIKQLEEEEKQRARKRVESNDIGAKGASSQHNQTRTQRYIGRPRERH